MHMYLNLFMTLRTVLNFTAILYNALLAKTIIITIGFKRYIFLQGLVISKAIEI